MASIISAGTTSGTSLNLSGDTSGVLQLASNGSTTAVTIDTSQNVGIGTSSPAAQLDVGSHLLFGLANDFLSNSSSCLIARTSAAGTGIFSEAGHLLLQPRSSFGRSIIFATGSTTATERMRIPAAGGVQAVTTISVGNATPAASGAGITFPATQSASSDANTLDDYEEGSWTPTLVFSGGAGTLSYGTQDGFYTKIGRTVYFSMRLVFSKGTASGTMDSITGLPFSSTSTNGGGVYIDGMNTLTGACQYAASGTSLFVYMSVTGNANSINATSMGASNNVFTVSGFYIT
jgi:hypothetical protein